MKFLISFVLWLLCFSSTGQEKKLIEIKGAKFIQYLRVSDTSGRKGVFDSTVTDIYSSGNILLYDLSYRYSSTINEIELVSEERHHYFIHAKDSLYGYDYDGYQQPFVKRVKVDSVLRELQEAKQNLERLFSPSESKLLASNHNADSGTAHEVYILWAKNDASQPATFFLDYTKQAISLQPNPLQSGGKIKNMNLCKVRILSECYPCSFDINYSIENIKVIKENITHIFDEYIGERSGIVQMSGWSTGNF